jgi:hypothetical protein
MTLEKGDRFIYYGRPKVVKGIVQKVTESVTFDLIHGVKTIKVTLVSEAGDKFDAALCRKVTGDLTPGFIIKLKRVLSK